MWGKTVGDLREYPEILGVPFPLFRVTMPPLLDKLLNMQVKIDTLPKKSFGSRLKEFRLKSGHYNASKFAQLAGISRATLYLWENQETPPHSKNWKSLCELLGVSENELIFGGERGFYSADVSKEIGTMIKETGGVHGVPRGAEFEARRLFDELIAAAKADPSRIGWIVEQMKLYLRVPAHWLTPSDPLDHPAVRAVHEQVKQMAAERRATQANAGAEKGSHQRKAAS
jgi:DNA-binding XRE family transcriptional regulator